MYSDFILERQPISVEEALEIFQDISQNFGSKEDSFALAAPKHVQLVPIKVVNNLFNTILLKGEINNFVFTFISSSSSI